MYSMSDDLKKYLLRQNRQFRSNQQPTLLTGAASCNPSSSTALLPRLVPQLTGDEGLMRRISIFGWGFGGSAATSSEGLPSPNDAPNSPGPSQVLVNNPPEDIQPLQPQTTGSSWGNWWISSGGEKNMPLEKGGLDSAKSAKWYIDTLRSGKAPDIKLVKHLITLRVHLSTANLAFIRDFVRNEKGMDMLGKLLAGLVGKGGKRRRLTEIESTVFLEVFKCLRALLNTEVSSDSKSYLL
jgi:diaphanous 1